MEKRKQVRLGGLTFGDGHIYIQSMLNRRAEDVAGNIEQAIALEKAGCEIVRAAIPRREDVRLIPALKEKISIPLVADIHFDYKLALEAAAGGVDKIRINPGNIGGDDRVKAVADECRRRKIPIRIGVNSGSLEKSALAKYGVPVPAAFVESAMYHVRLLEKFDFDDIVISIKSSDVKTTIAAYRLLAEECRYPLHVGVTESGTERMGLIKSSVGIGSLLCDGIGDTIRVSLTADPIREIYAARDLLKAIGLGEGVDIVSCPTCGRTRIDLIALAGKVEAATRGIKKPLKIAVMGCAVNGPGEAKEADLGVAGGDGEGLIFKKGEILRKVPEERIVEELLKEIEALELEEESAEV
ncbi:MAG: flavodoxin-dependent (E)-4-hydroxy-3-methylbut-2-enyl-diphosphate synthase [Bacteroides sp.]|nr:flavodoxin-dependent (E)-4-hydroxy-3-methylbut-2-enyl-diphosphate synthase [Eubacterium sp.]MCM1418709.1 flavodoxin-dependent (E)-4-hydroxy-3-methylbut-2-enyl-diphosphate synthase [Roseburia sp.]MCM1462737.1 flavodoxin-dependent (E)-4-hydroxy-3-methylbut-2-enyl-diphosphate synthase [Bacteroides sp.]